MGGKLVDQSACHLFDAGDFSPRPDRGEAGGNISEGGKRLAPGMQKDQVEGATFGECAHGADPENTLLQACESSCSFRFGEVPIPSFVILHACLSNEWPPI